MPPWRMFSKKKEMRRGREEEKKGPAEDRIGNAVAQYESEVGREVH